MVAVSTALAARNGLLIRNRAAFERARKLQAIIFDKTGTLTEGRFGVTDTVVFTKEMDERQLLNYAAAVLMSLSTVFVAINARLLHVAHRTLTEQRGSHLTSSYR